MNFKIKSFFYQIIPNNGIYRNQFYDRTSKNVNDDDLRIRYISNSRGDKAVSSKCIVRCVQFSWIKMKKKYSD